MNEPAIDAHCNPQRGSAGFETLWRACAAHVRAYIGAVLFDRSLRDDLLQNTAMAAFQKFDQYDPNRPFTSWAIGIARLEVLRARRSIARAKVVFDSEAVDKITAVYQAKIDEYDYRREALAKCLEHLPEEKRALLRLRYFESMPYPDIAAKLTCQEGAVRTMLCRLRAALDACIRRRLSQEGIRA